MGEAKLAALDSPFVDTLPASDAPVPTFPGHRRDNAFSAQPGTRRGSAPATAIARLPAILSARFTLATCENTMPACVAH